MSARDDIAGHFTSAALADELLDAHAAEVRRGDAARLVDECRQYPSRGIFCGGIKHAAELLSQWAEEEKDTSGGSFVLDEAGELERLRNSASITERRYAQIRARLAMVDIRDSGEAWDLGMAVIAVLEGPLRPDDEMAPCLADFEIVHYTLRGYRVADEYRCRNCGAIGAQGTEPKTLADLIGMVMRHECLPRVEGGEG